MRSLDGVGGDDAITRVSLEASVSSKTTRSLVLSNRRRWPSSSSNGAKPKSRRGIYIRHSVCDPSSLGAYGLRRPTFTGRNTREAINLKVIEDGFLIALVFYKIYKKLIGWLPKSRRRHRQKMRHVPMKYDRLDASVASSYSLDASLSRIAVPSYNSSGFRCIQLLRVRLSVSKFFLATVLLPLSAFVFCVAWSLWFHFRDVTYTHCRVPNYLPSISAAIGTYSPQNIVWKSAIAAHFPGRLLALSYYWRWYSKVLHSAYAPLSKLACILHIVENVSLVGLSFFNSALSFSEFLASIRALLFGLLFREYWNGLHCERFVLPYS
ncbi:unnamed protein product [Notodromas monacha]|uniref:CWH43-like N-terminal domain-containing protein n=1 Tax=Notodromas monacha TaxID=399045 RepID=A0A7R9GG25_9CRUS|nr:unnamed protein product [Notodromas monacha]CAG0921258.1 unnamed protein product [Notodromas monacha]